jgi:hypothetical protein
MKIIPSSHGNLVKESDAKKAVEAMRIETLEKAATYCEQLTWYEDSEWFAAAIRCMK